MMTAEINTTQSFHPKKFAMWLAMASMFMLFAAFTSALIVRRAQGNWQAFQLPTIFWVNTLIILCSSFTIARAVLSFKKYNVTGYRIWLVATFILGTAFLIGQWMGWEQLAAGGIHLDGNPSGSFLYVISGTHAAHILGGVIALFVITLRAFFVRFNPNRLSSIQIMATYWHFVDVLWIYLFILFKFYLS